MNTKDRTYSSAILDMQNWTEKAMKMNKANEI